MPELSSEFTLTIGLALSFILYGILVSQTVTYFRSRSNDMLWTKLIVSVVVLLETAMVIFDVDKMYLECTASADFDESGLLPPHAMFSGNTVMMSLVSATVQLFFVWRVSALSSHRILPGLIALCSVCSLALGLALHIMGISRIIVSEIPPADIAGLEDFTVYGVTHNSFALVLSWLLLCAVVDIILSIYLTCYLLRRKTGFRSSDLLIRKIVRLTVETGIITSVCAILDAALHATHNFAVPMFIPDLMLSKLYANSLLASLNARSKWADDMDSGMYQVE